VRTEKYFKTLLIVIIQFELEMKKMSDNKNSVHLKQDLRAIDVFGLALGCIIGWGCFVLPGNQFLAKAGPLGMALGMSVGAGLVAVISLCYGYMIRKIPMTGGEFTYGYSVLGKKIGFIAGWALVLVYWAAIPMNATAIGMIGRYLFPGILQRGLLYTVAGWEVYAGEVIFASFFVILFAYINIKGVKTAGWVQSATTIALVGAILIITVATLISGPDFSNLQPGFVPGKAPFACIFAITAMAPWAFMGFGCIPQAASEYSFSPRKAMWLLLAAVVIATGLYICINTVTAIYMPWTEMLENKPFWATGTAIETIMGKPGLVIVGIAMFSAVLSSMNGSYLAASRVMYSMAKMDALPEWFGELDEKYCTPKHGIIFVAVLALIAPWFGREVLGWIVDMTSFGGDIAFGITCIATTIIAFREKDILYTVIGILGTLCSMFFLGLLIIPGAPGFLSIQAASVLVVWMIGGGVLYLKVRQKYNASTKDISVINEPAPCEV